MVQRFKKTSTNQAVKYDEKAVAESLGGTLRKVGYG